MTKEAKKPIPRGRSVKNPMPGPTPDRLEKARPTAMVKPRSYQPSKAELEEDVSVDATPEEVRAALMRPVGVKKSVG